MAVKENQLLLMELRTQLLNDRGSETVCSATVKLTAQFYPGLDCHALPFQQQNRVKWQSMQHSVGSCFGNVATKVSSTLHLLADFPGLTKTGQAGQRWGETGCAEELEKEAWGVGKNLMVMAHAGAYFLLFEPSHPLSVLELMPVKELMLFQEDSMWSVRLRI